MVTIIWYIHSTVSLPISVVVVAKVRPPQLPPFDGGGYHSRVGYRCHDSEASSLSDLLPRTLATVGLQEYDIPMTVLTSEAPHSPALGDNLTRLDQQPGVELVAFHD
jgi:hypothetical protein